MHDPVAYAEGIRLFNKEQYWHAHEQWELCWMHSPEPDNTFYKGIIQAAAALYHWQKGNSRGLQRNWHKSRLKLVGLPSPYMGINLEQFIGAMDEFSRQHIAPTILAPTQPRLPLPRLSITKSG